MLPTSWKDSWEQMHERRNYLSVFLYITLGSFGLFALLSLLSLGKLFPSIFFVRGTDSFMDFFNSIRDAAQGIEAYTERHIIYPPMANLFFWLLAKITPERYNNTTFEDRRNWLGEPVAIALLLVFLVLCAVLFAFLVWRNLKTDRRSKLLFTAASVCCLPFVTMMERGNILILCVLALLVYTATYDSDRWYAREIGLLALAFAFSIKLYPILFAWLLLSDKRVAAFLRCMLYSVAMLILPSFFFGGPQVFLSLLKNIFSFSEGGGGFPSLVIGILAPHVSVFSVDSVTKKVNYVKESAKMLKINLDGSNRRAEELGQDNAFREKFDIACARAVGRLNLICELCLPLVRVGGYFIAMKSVDTDKELIEAERAIELLGGKVSEVKKYKLTNGNEEIERSVILVKKISQTPEKYPRNNSQISKRPL